jgi:hypothetical protein
LVLGAVFRSQPVANETLTYHSFSKNKERI